MTEPPRLPYADRTEAGQVLAGTLTHLIGRPGLLVLALPRGGVPVAFEIARSLQAPLDVCVVRKLGFPGHAEYAMGAIASGGVRVMNPMPGLHVKPADIDRVVAHEQAELRRREQLYRGDAPPLAIADRTVILVDDGLATGATMRAAAMAVRQQRPALLCIAVPVGAAESCEALRGLADELHCAARPQPFRAVGQWYRDFPQTSDDQVRRLLADSRQWVGAAHAGAS